MLRTRKWTWGYSPSMGFHCFQGFRGHALMGRICHLSRRLLSQGENENLQYTVRGYPIQPLGLCAGSCGSLSFPPHAGFRPGCRTSEPPELFPSPKPGPTRQSRKGLSPRDIPVTNIQCFGVMSCGNFHRALPLPVAIRCLEISSPRKARIGSWEVWVLRHDDAVDGCQDPEIMGAVSLVSVNPNSSRASCLQTSWRV